MNISEASFEHTPFILASKIWKDWELFKKVYHSHFLENVTEKMNFLTKTKTKEYEPFRILFIQQKREIKEGI